MYPLVFNDVYKDYIWGGRNLELFGKKLSEGITAESWEISCHPDGPSIVSNGVYQGMKLMDLVSCFPKQMMGDRLNSRFKTTFPLLVKLIDAQNKLSVQVHPDDSYALLHENENGKNEMWYILWAAPDAELIYDVKENINQDLFFNSISKGRLEDCLNRVKVKEGDVIYIPAGLVHAIGAGIVLIEIQQNSNSTYRVYDYNRIGKDGKTRPLHIEKAMDVIDFKKAGRRAIYRGLTISSPERDRKLLAASEFFCAEDWRVKTQVAVNTGKDRFYLLTCLDGDACVQWKGECTEIEKGKSCMIPAECDGTVIKGLCRLIVSYIPDIEQDVINPLLNAGYDESTIKNEIPGIRGKGVDY